MIDTFTIDSGRPAEILSITTSLFIKVEQITWYHSHSVTDRMQGKDENLARYLHM